MLQNFPPLLTLFELQESEIPVIRDKRVKAGVTRVLQHPQCKLKVCLQFFIYCTAPTRQDTGKEGVGAAESGRNLAVSFTFYSISIHATRAYLLYTTAEVGLGCVLPSEVEGRVGFK